MENSTVNFNTSGASVNSTTEFTELLNTLEKCVYILNFLLGLSVHSYVIWLIITGSGITSGFFILNLSVCETGVCMKCLFVWISGSWFLNLSALTRFLSGLGITGRPLFQCLVCVERYLAVVHPVTFLKFKPLRYRVMCAAVTWIICFGSCLCCCFFMVSTALNMFIWLNSVQFFLFLSIQLFCCVSVLRALKQSGPGERGREREEENHMKRRAFHLILITTVSTVVTYGPYILTGLVSTMATHLMGVLRFIGKLFFLLAGFVHPSLYLHSAGKLSCLCAT